MTLLKQVIYCSSLCSLQRDHDAEVRTFLNATFRQNTDNGKGPGGLDVVLLSNAAEINLCGLLDNDVNASAAAFLAEGPTKKVHLGG